MKFFHILLLFYCVVFGVQIAAAQTEAMRENAGVPEPRVILVTLRGAATVSGNLIRLDPDKLELVTANGLRIIAVNDIATIAFDHTAAARMVRPAVAPENSAPPPAAKAHAPSVPQEPRAASQQPATPPDTPRGYSKPHDKPSRRGSREATRRLEEISGPPEDTAAPVDETRTNPAAPAETGRPRAVSALPSPPAEFDAGEEARIERERADSLRKERESRARIERARAEAARERAARDRKERAARDRAERERQDRLARERKDREAAALAAKNKARDDKKGRNSRDKEDTRDRKRADNAKDKKERPAKDDKNSRDKAKKPERAGKDEKKKDSGKDDKKKTSGKGRRS